MFHEICMTIIFLHCKAKRSPETTHVRKVFTESCQQHAWKEHEISNNSLIIWDLHRTFAPIPGVLVYNCSFRVRDFLGHLPRGGHLPDHIFDIFDNFTIFILVTSHCHLVLFSVLKFARFSVSKYSQTIKMKRQAIKDQANLILFKIL